MNESIVLPVNVQTIHQYQAIETNFVDNTRLAMPKGNKGNLLYIYDAVISVQ